MTVPGGVPNLPEGALTLDTIASKTQDHSVEANQARASARVAGIFGGSTGGDPMNEATPFGIITQLFSGFNSHVANANPADIQGPDDLPALLVDFINELPLVAQFIDLSAAITGDYTGEDPTLLTIQAVFEPINALVAALSDLDFSSFEAFLDSLTDALTGFTTTDDFQGLVDTIWQSLTMTTATGKLYGDLLDALRNIPSGSVLGVGGPLNIGDSMQQTWDKWVSGLVGSLGTGAGLADLFNLGSDISSRASLGMFSWDILGIRNNKSLNSGFLPTSESNIALDKIALQASAPTFALTQSTAITAYQRIAESADKAAVSWMGSGVTNVNNAYVNIFQMDPATGLSTLVHASADIAGLLSATMQYNVYTLPTALPVVAGEIYGIEIAIRGAGTHTVVGQSTWLPAHPTVFPQKMSSVRNSGTSAPPSTIAHSSLTYSSNVPFVEFAVTAGDPGLPHSPVIEFYNALGTVTRVIPTWCNVVQVVTVGGGGGGRQGSALGVWGEGGDAGTWVTGTWTRGTDFTGSPSISITINAGGSGGNVGSGGSGGAGGTAVASISGHSVTGTGGGGGTSLGAKSNNPGGSPGNQTYDTIVYVGGGVQNTAGAAGAAPGGGGAGGNNNSSQFGGAGAAGGVWLRFKQ